MRISKPDIELRENFIREEIKKHPGATVDEINDSVKKKFGMGTDRRKISKIKELLTPKKAEDGVLVAANILKERMKGSSYISIAFLRDGNNVKVVMDKEEVTRSMKRVVLK